MKEIMMHFNIGVHVFTLILDFMKILCLFQTSIIFCSAIRKLEILSKLYWNQIFGILIVSIGFPSFIMQTIFKEVEQIYEAFLYDVSINSLIKILKGMNYAHSVQ